MNPRFGQATTTYLHVQERNEDLRKVEQSIAELANMIQIMSMHVEEHGDKIRAIVKNTEEVRDNTRAGYVQRRIPFQLSLTQMWSVWMQLRMPRGVQREREG